MYLGKMITSLLFVISLATPISIQAQGHPNLILTQAGVEKIRDNLGKVPLFDATVQRVKQEVDAEIAFGIDTPIPKDFSGGYTHQRHKLNFQTAQKAGMLYQILQDEKYAVYVRDMLLQYEAMYQDLPIHPQTRSYARGKLFWQCLNDANWLVYMSQAYDAIYESLSVKERAQLENNLFRPFADFISIGNPQFYNRIHNHSTWGNAAVGMIALVMNDKALLHRALYGIEDDGLALDLKDNDGGLIKVAGQKAGFLANLEEPFSPDGYFTEGPYYQRYAMYPFLIFGLAMHNIKPDMQVFEHKGNVLLKAVDALLNLSDADGEFFPLNDGQKGMSYYSPELVTAVDIAYHYGSQNPKLLSVVEKQGLVLLDESGLSAAMAIRDGKAEPFAKASINLSDGADGKQGGVAVLRYGNEDLTLVFKYSAQGSSHGHYDKLSYSLYTKGNEVLQDYGLARFVNIQQKGGGNYLKENSTWAKQTIAHNTLTQNQRSQFNGDYETASKYHPDLYFFDAANEDAQAVSAKDTHAYPGTEMQRTMVMLKLKDFENPIILDIMKVSSESKNQYDFPFYYMGQVIKMNFEYDSPSSLSPLGETNGYQHLYVEGKGKPSADTTQFSWLGNGTFYTLTTVTNSADELLLTRLGATDPEFNLRRDAALMIRRKKTGDTVFASVIEPHGAYSLVSELSENANSKIAKLKVAHDDANYTAVSIEDVKGQTSLFILANVDASISKQHQVEINGKSYRWTGPYYFIDG
jgi:oligo-alginate lyase